MSSWIVVSKEAKKMAEEITLLVAAEINVGRLEKLAKLCERYLRKATDQKTEAVPKWALEAAEDAGVELNLCLTLEGIKTLAQDFADASPFQEAKELAERVLEERKDTWCSIHYGRGKCACIFTEQQGKAHNLLQKLKD